RDALPDQLPVRLAHVEAVLGQHRLDRDLGRHMSFLQQLRDHGRADLKLALGVEVHLVDRAAGREDVNLHRGMLRSALGYTLPAFGKAARTTMARSARIIVAALLSAAFAACTPPSPSTPSTPGPTTADALAFLDEVERQFTALGEEAARIGWVNETYINFDTDWLTSNVGARFTELGVKYAKQATDFDDVDVPADARRKLELLKLGLTLPAPDKPG